MRTGGDPGADPGPACGQLGDPDSPAPHDSDPVTGSWLVGSRWVPVGHPPIVAWSGGILGSRRKGPVPTDKALRTVCAGQTETVFVASFRTLDAGVF